MRSDPKDYELVAPSSLQTAVELLAGSPREWLPIAGGTDIMVQYAAGKLPSRKLVSIWNLAELRHMEVLANEIRVGAGCTYTDIREHEVLGREFPLLARAACWTGADIPRKMVLRGWGLLRDQPSPIRPAARQDRAIEETFMRKMIRTGISRALAALAVALVAGLAATQGSAADLASQSCDAKSSSNPAFCKAVRGDRADLARG